MSLEPSSKSRLDAFADTIGAALTPNQRQRLSEYALGLLLPGERKSMEPMAARVDPEHPMARYKTFQRFISVTDWDDRAVRRAAFGWVRETLLGDGSPDAWVLDDTGFVKQGKESVFVQRQYSGTLGKVGNCQVAVSLSVATEQQSFPLDMELYMPEDWANSPGRREAARVPPTLAFRTKPRIALDLIERALQDGVPTAPVIVDAGYGNDGAFRGTLDLLGLDYVAEVRVSTLVRRANKIGRPSKNKSILHLVHRLPRADWTDVTWREGTKGPQVGKFISLRVRVPRDQGAAHRDDPDLWLLVERRPGRKGQFKCWLANLPANTTLERLVQLAHIRWRIERDYEDLKEELGLDHFEGRSYIGWNHHVSVCIAAFAFLLQERPRLSPPADPAVRRTRSSPGGRPRGSDPA